MVTLFACLYGPINQLSNLQIITLTVLVSFDRIFGLLDPKPLIAERPGAPSTLARRRRSGTAFPCFPTG
jgi:ATP-binding cassette, subfamily B, bacterial